MLNAREQDAGAASGGISSQDFRAVAEATAADFAGALEHVSRVRSAGEAVDSEVARLLAVIRNQERERTSETEAEDGGARLLRAIAAADRLAAALADPVLEGHCVALEGHLIRAARATHELQVVAMMTKVVSVGASWTRAEAAAYTRMFEELVGQLGEQIGGARANSEPIGVKRRAAAARIAAAASALSLAHRAMLSRGREAAEASAARDDALARLEGDADRIAACSRLQIARLVSCLQFADAFTQRVDNALRVLEAAEGLPAEDRDAAAALVAAQVEALATDHASARSEAEEALAAMLDAASAGAAGFLPARNDPVRHWLDAQGEALAARMEAVATARARLKEADELLLTVRETASGAGAAIAGFRGLVARLELAACNAAIAAMRSGNAGALHVLAARVDAAAKDCMESLQASMQSLAAIETHLDALERGAVAVELDALTDEQAEAREAAEAQREGLQQQTEARAGLAAAVSAVGSGARSALVSIRRCAANEAVLGRAAGSLAPGGTTLVPQRNLDWAWRLYTTEAERHTHRKVAGGPDPLPADTEDAQDDELDGFLL